MKAVVFDRYGPPDVMRIEELPIPEPRADHVLVKIAAVGVNAADWRLLRGQPILVRPTAGGLRKPKLRILGADLAGRVETIGTGVTSFAVGDAVSGHTSECGLRRVRRIRQRARKRAGAKTGHVELRRGCSNPGLILDAAAYRPLRDIRAAVHPDGTYVMVGGSPSRSLALLLAGPLIRPS